MALPAALLAIVESRKFHRFFYAVTALLIITATILTHTRAILLGYILTIPFLIFFLMRNKAVLKKILLSGTFLLVLFSISMMSMPTFKSRIVNGITLKSNSIRARIHYWRCTWELVKIKPWTGWGLGSFQVEYPAAQIKVRTQHLDNGTRATEIVTHPHNEYLMLLTEGGIVLLTSVLLLIIQIFWSCIKNILTLPPPRNVIRLGYLSGLIIVATDAFFSFPFYVGTSGLISICLASLAVFQEKEE